MMKATTRGTEQRRACVLLACGAALWLVLAAAAVRARRVDAAQCATAAPDAHVPAQRVAAGLVTVALPLRAVSAVLRAPCLVHRTARTADALARLAPAARAAYAGSWLRLLPPTCATLLWDDAAGTALVRAAEPRLVPQYRWLRTGTERGDVARLVALYHHGGVYADLDVELVRAPAAWTFGARGPVRLVVGMEFCRNGTRHHTDDYGVVQFALAAAPHHPVVRRALDTIDAHVRAERTTGDVYYRTYGYNARLVRRTGPVVLSDAVRAALRARGLDWPDVCASRAPFRVPNSDILILPWRSLNARHNHSIGYTAARHYFHGGWKWNLPGAWYVPD